MKIALFPSRQSLPQPISRRLIALFAALLLTPLALQHAAAGMTYKIDPAAGNDTNPLGKPWKTFGRLNAVKLAPGDTVLIAPGVQQETLKPTGEGTAKDPVVIKFLPGIHTLGINKVTRKQLFISNSIDSTEPIPIGLMLSQVKHFSVQGGGVDGAGKTTLLYDGRMMQILNENSEDIEYSGLVLDMNRPAVSEIRVLETKDSTTIIQVAEGSVYQIDNGRFLWKGDWLGGGLLTQQLELKTGACGRRGALRGWTTEGQTEAKATDLGDRRVKIEFPDGASDLMPGHQYHFRNTSRVMCGIHSTRSARITFRDCEINALPCMGFVSQFTDTMTIQRVNVVPPANTIRTCPAWGDIFQFSNCKGDILLESCRLSGMQDDALNCHGTYLRLVEKRGERQWLVRFAHPQTYGFAPYAPGDEIAVMSASTMREYPGNPRAKVGKVERITDKDWLITLDGAVPNFQANDVIDNITWNPNLTARNNHVSVNPVRGFLLGTRGKIIVENNVFERCTMPGILVEGDAASWFESSPIRDLLIQKNRFINCGIHITSTVHEPKPDEPVHENIRILNNTFENGGISVKAVRGLVIKDNQSGNAPLQIDAAPSSFLPPVGDNAGAVREGTLRVLSFGLGAPMEGPPVDDLYGRDAVFFAEAIKRAPSAWSKVETTAVSGLDCTPERLRNELKRLEETAVAADFVIVHASTHGTTKNKLLRLEGSKTVIDANVLAASLGRLPCPSLVSIDACQAGGAVHSRLPAKSAWLLGCTETQSTSGQGDDPKVPHGFQVLALCEALRGDADADRDGVITVGELCAWVPRRATFLALFSCYQVSVVVLPPALAKLPLTRVTPGEKKPLWTMRKVESRNPWGVQDVPELATDAAPADKLTAAIKARAGETKARVGSEGIAKPAEKGRGLEGVWVSRRGANKTEQLQRQGHVEIAETEQTFFAAVVDSSGSYLIEAVRDPADPNRLSGRWSKLDSPEPSSRWEGRIVDSRRIDGQAPGGGWDLRRLKSN